MRVVLRAALRLLCLSACLAAGLGAASLFGVLPAARRDALVRAWTRLLLRALGVRLRVTGAPATGPMLIVANHVSWLDVMAIAAVRPATFVCKSEIAAWPLVGWLLRRAGTVFIRRRSLRDLLRVNDELRARFARGEAVAAFPEGTTTDGSVVLPFRPALFQPAIERGLPVQPVALAYSGAEAAYVGETSFATSLLSIALARGLEARISFLEPCAATGSGRKHTARAARAAVSGALLGPGEGVGIRQQAPEQGAARVADRRVVHDLGEADALRQA